MAVNGRRCPRFEHACTTDEGARLWDAVQRSSAWTGGGMTPRRIDRAAVRARMDGVPGWIVETLLDAFEPAALNAAAISEKRQEKPRNELGSSREEEGDDD